MGTRTGIPAGLVSAVLCGAGLLLAGCGGSGDAVSTFAGGTSSREKQEPLPATQASAAGNLASAVPGELGSGSDPASGVATGLKGPDAVSKGAEKRVPASEEERKALREKRMAYKARQYRDPFLSLIGDDKSGSTLVDLSVVTLVGVVTSERGAFCIVEDAEGTSFILRKGDRVKNGRIVSIGKDTLTASQTVLGYTTTVRLQLENEKDGIHG